MKGSCLCKSIQYEVDTIEPQMAHCHCQMCRKWHGAAFASYGEAKPENFRWLKGASSFDNGGLIEFALGTLDEVIDDRPDANIFTNYKADWFEITDNLPVYKEGRNTND